jgi:hypothetical protein
MFSPPLGFPNKDAVFRSNIAVVNRPVIFVEFGNRRFNVIDLGIRGVAPNSCDAL